MQNKGEVSSETLANEDTRVLLCGHMIPVCILLWPPTRASQLVKQEDWIANRLAW